jgi:hypothetical protein
MGWDRQICQKAEDLPFFVFNLRIPTLLSPIAEDLDWNGRRFWADFSFYNGDFGRNNILFKINQEYDSRSL